MIPNIRQKCSGSNQLMACYLTPLVIKEAREKRLRFQTVNNN